MSQPEQGSAGAAQAFDPVLGDEDFVRIARLVHDMAGIVLAQNKRPLVQSRLLKRVRALKLGCFSAYADLVSQPDSIAERQALVSAVTTNVTSFFREQHHFVTLAERVLAPLAASIRAGRRLRLWSAACSSGEEPYSMAAVVASMFPDAKHHDIRILATDIDRMMLDRAVQATYPAEAIADLAEEHRRILFGAVRGTANAKVCDPVAGLVSCRLLNLNDDWPMRGPFDVIFCRNVVIYFDKPTQENLWQRFAQIIAPGGYLMVGHSERLSGPALAAFEPDGITTYRRR